MPQEHVSFGLCVTITNREDVAIEGEKVGQIRLQTAQWLEAHPAARLAGVGPSPALTLPAVSLLCFFSVKKRKCLKR